MTSKTTRTWFDRAGNPFQAPADATTCTGFGDEETHLIFEPFDPTMLRALTLCGISAGRIPGGDEVTCRECQDARGW